MDGTRGATAPGQIATEIMAAMSRARHCYLRRMVGRDGLIPAYCPAAAR
jgi:hypothetical protein